jgi:N-acetylglutamate synthase-like GNAT family acetyltransferase
MKNDFLNSVIIKIAELNEKPSILSFYRKCNYRDIQGINLDDIFIIAKKNDAIIGVCRLSEEPINTKEFLILRGINIDPKYQRHGIGIIILEMADKLTKARKCYLIGQVHLESFFHHIKFIKIQEKDFKNNVPTHLIERFIKYQKEKPLDKYIIMVKN